MLNISVFVFLFKLFASNPQPNFFTFGNVESAFNYEANNYFCTLLFFSIFKNTKELKNEINIPFFQSFIIKERLNVSKCIDFNYDDNSRGFCPFQLIKASGRKPRDISKFKFINHRTNTSFDIFHILLSEDFILSVFGTLRANHVSEHFEFFKILLSSQTPKAIGAYRATYPLSSNQTNSNFEDCLFDCSDFLLKFIEEIPHNSPYSRTEIFKNFTVLSNIINEISGGTNYNDENSIFHHIFRICKFVDALYKFDEDSSPVDIFSKLLVLIKIMSQNNIIAQNSRNTKRNKSISDHKSLLNNQKMIFNKNSRDIKMTKINKFPKTIKIEQKPEDDKKTIKIEQKPEDDKLVMLLRKEYLDFMKIYRNQYRLIFAQFAHIQTTVDEKSANERFLITTAVLDTIHWLVTLLCNYKEILGENSEFITVYELDFKQIETLKAPKEMPLKSNFKNQPFSNKSGILTFNNYRKTSAFRMFIRSLLVLIQLPIRFYKGNKMVGIEEWNEKYRNQKLKNQNNLLNKMSFLDMFTKF